MSTDRATDRRGEPSSEDTGSTEGRDLLASQMGDVARIMQQVDDPHQALEGIVRAAVDVIPGADEGSVSLVIAGREVRSEAASGELPRLADHLMNTVGQGPCLDAIYTQRTVRVPDMATEQRWPEFSAGAAALGAGSMLSFQLYVEGDNLGALNLYATKPHAFDDDSEHVGLLFATHAALAYVGLRREVQLTTGMSTRDVIGQAKGILMERYKLDADKAFRVLVRYSQERNLKLHDVALQLVAQLEAEAIEV